ncbi:MAG TPA: ABC transporter ATP-binding protein [Rectinemataceae bacterium]|nr:ABC transporter ATP-binding protein [Rectinemataceae bacterium]
MSELVTTGLTKRFGGLVAVKDLSFQLTRGEILGVIGPNGAGKSTFINLVSGVHLPTSGTITFKGRDITRFPAHRRSSLGIARTFQLIHPFEALDVRENVMLGLLFAQKLGRKEARREAEALCESLELGGLGRSVAEITMLEIKKMEIARALACRPEILFLDEVMAGLSSDETKSVIALVRGIAGRRNIGVGVVEHVMAVIRELTHRVLVLEAGELIAEGPYDEVVQNPRVIEAYLGGALQ